MPQITEQVKRHRTTAVTPGGNPDIDARPLW